MTQYLYDAAGQRVAKGTISVFKCNESSNGFTLTNQYLFGPSGEQMTELGPSAAWIHTNVYANGSLIATYSPSGLFFHFSDWVGNRRVQTDFAGNNPANWQNLPFGMG
jgi:hypothetical protein